jgi:hypothetical protein
MERTMNQNLQSIEQVVALFFDGALSRFESDATVAVIAPLSGRPLTTIPPAAMQMWIAQ